MKPSVSRPETIYQTGNRDTNKKIRCPDGTIPILRTTKRYVSKARRFEELHFNPLTADSHGTHVRTFPFNTFYMLRGLDLRL